MQIKHLFAFFVFAIHVEGSAIAAETDPNVLVPDTIRPIKPVEKISIEPPTVPLENKIPNNAEQLNITLSEIIVPTPYPAFAQATETFIQQIQNKQVSLAFIYQQAANLEQAYTEAGYLLVRVVIPPQELRENGALHVNVIEGFIEEIDVTHLPKATQSAVLARTQHLINKRAVTLKKLEHSLLVAGDMPGVKLTSTLAHGSQEGGAKLIINCDCQRFSMVIGFDNHLDSSLDRWQSTALFSVNSLTGWQSYGMLGTGANWTKAFTNDAISQLVGLGIVAPIGTSGLTLNPEYIASTVRPPLSTANSLRTQGEFERYALRLQYPWIKSRQQMLDLKLGIDRTKQKTEAVDFNTNINKDRYDTLRVGLDYSRRLDRAGFQTSFNLSQGLGGRNTADANNTGIPLSRLSATPNFTKLNGALRYSHAFDNALQGTLTALGQTAFNHALLRAEQFTLDGKDGLSPFPAGTLTADTGATLRAELTRAFNVNFGQQGITLAPYAFIAAGWGKVYAPTVLENANLHANAWGLGLRSYINQNSEFPVSVGFELGEGHANQDNFEDFWRANLNVLLSY
jgi:hemolysin activation/secretion protein